MSELLTIFVVGEPRPKQSFRVSGKGGYQPARVKAWQSYVASAAQQSMREAGRTNQPYERARLEVNLHFYLGNARRVDLDNLSKAVLDGMNKIVFNDDQQVIDLHVSKRIAEKPEDIGVAILIKQASREFCTCEMPEMMGHLQGYCKNCGQLVETVSKKR